jgi:hypothetical protein
LVDVVDGGQDAIFEFLLGSDPDMGICSRPHSGAQLEFARIWRR